MTRDELFNLHDELTSHALDLMKRKNADYAKHGPFDNFKMCESMGLATTETGILIRLTDKLSRLSSIFEKGARVSESEEDTIVDIINYAVCLAGVRREKGEIS